jgi:hypothetical protein
VRHTVQWVFNIQVQSELPKSQNPLYKLIEYAAEASIEDRGFLVIHLISGTAQRAPECDMVLVHDEDLVSISSTCDSDVSRRKLFFPRSR